MTGSDVEVLPPLSVAGRRALAWWKSNPMLPASYRNSKTGVVDLEGMERATRLLLYLHLDPIATLGDTFVIKDQVGFKADLQRAILTRPGTGYDFEILDVDDEHVTARIKTPGGWKAPLTKRITDRDIVTYAARNTENYRDKPRRMLEARVTTELIDLYAKGVLRGMVGAAGVGYAEDDDDATAPAVPMTPVAVPRSVTPDGSTIPQAWREKEVSPTVRAELRARIEALLDERPDAYEQLLERWKLTPRPGLSSHNFTVTHGELLAIYLDQAAIDADIIPDATGDDDPEAYGYEPDDDGRPFE
jgi:hypothetical protein